MQTSEFALHKSDGSPEQRLPATLQALASVILGKEEQLELAVACILARGHLLIEDLPGVGKTTLAHTLANVLGLGFQRIQFTSDMLPADITGVSIYQPDNAKFEFHPGPIFSQLVLADEVNRATPKAQSALLEAMQEQQITVDGKSYALPEPFFVVATQNPADQIGTFELPESQLDRFLMRIELGYPSPEKERELLSGKDRRDLLPELPKVLNPELVLALQNQVDAIKMSDALLDYVQALIAFTRTSNEYLSGASPRGAIALTRAARALALVKGRHVVYPDDVQAVLPAVIGHRLVPASGGNYQQPAAIGRHILEAVAIP